MVKITVGGRSSGFWSFGNIVYFDQIDKIDDFQDFFGCWGISSISGIGGDCWELVQNNREGSLFVRATHRHKKGYTHGYLLPLSKGGQR